MDACLANQETKEGLTEEYLKIVADRRKNGFHFPEGTMRRFEYLRARIPLLLKTTEDFLWAAEQYAGARCNSGQYVGFLPLALAKIQTFEQASRLFQLIPNTYHDMRRECLEKVIALSADKAQLAEFVRKYIK